MQGHAMLNEALYDAVIKTTLDAYLILDSKFTIIEATNAYLKAMRVKRADLIGLNVCDLIIDNPKRTKERQRNNIKRSLLKVLKTKRPHTMSSQKFTIHLPPFKNEEIEHDYRPLNTPVLDKNNEVQYIIHRIENLSMPHRLKNSKAKSIQRLQLLLEHIKDYAIIMFDEKEHIITWNVAAEQVTGYKAEEVLGKPFSLIYPTQHVEHEFKTAKATGRYTEEAWHERKDGSKFWAKMSMSAIRNNQNELLGYGKIICDLTLKKEIEIAKNEFISIVNHELRTPLTSILGAIRLLKNWSSQSPQKNDELLYVANTNCDRVMGLINDVLDIEKLTDGAMSLDMQETELNSFISKVTAQNKRYHEQFDVKITSSTLPFDLKVNADPNRLTQVLSNLISNAVKFSVAKGEVNVSLIKKNKVARVKVTNVGAGIPADFENKIFDKFSKADVSTTRSIRGIGLGLAISKAIMEQFGQTIRFKSKPGKETTFYFDLPFIQRK
jgi:PAS domain S-box-containing protein